jgi:hypothetical protein
MGTALAARRGEGFRLAASTAGGDSAAAGCVGGGRRTARMRLASRSRAWIGYAQTRCARLRSPRGGLDGLCLLAAAVGMLDDEVGAWGRGREQGRYAGCDGKR